jgi:hypothetical protein
MQDMLADIKENQLRRLDDIGAHWTERQPLDLRTLHLRQGALLGVEGHRGIRRVDRVERRHDGSRAPVQNQAVGFGMAGEADAKEIGDLALVPSEERADPGETGNGRGRPAAPHEEILALAAARQVAQLDLAGRRVPGIDHLRPAATAKQFRDGGRQVGSFDRQDLDRGVDIAGDDGAHGNPADKGPAIEAR